MKKHTAFLLDASRELLSDVRKLIEFRKTKRKKFELPEEEQAHVPSIKQGKKGLKGITLPPPTGFETPKMPKDRKSESKVSMRKTPPTTPKSSDETQKQSEMSVDAKRSASLIAVKKKQSKGKLEREKLLRELEAKERAEKIFLRQQRKLRRQRIREFKKLRTASRFRSLRKIFCFTEPQRKVIRQILISEHVLSTVQPPSLNYSLVTLIDDTVDHRINWIKEKVFNFFNIEYNSAFLKMWNRKDGKYKRMIGNLVFSQFNQNMENVVLFFYETKYEQTRYKIVSVEYETNIEEEPVRGTIISYHKEEPSTSNLSEEKPEPQITVQPQERSEGIVKKKSFRGKKPKVIITKAYIPVKYKRIIPQLHVVTINQICSFVNRGMLYNQDFFYVLRKPFPRVPYCDTYEEAHAQMPKYFHTGNFKISQVSCQFFVFVNIIQQYLNLNLKEPMFRFETTEFLQKDLRRLTGLTECRLTDRLLWSHCYSGNLLFRRYIYEKNNWPLKFGKPIEGNHQSNRIIDGGSLFLEGKKMVSEKFMSDLYKYIVSKKLPKEKVPYKAILYELGKGEVGPQITGTLKRQKNCSPYETTSDEKLRCSYIDRQMSVLHSRTEWCYKVLQRGTSFHFNVRNYLEKHENLESLFNDKNFISKLNKFKECRKYLKHLKSYVTAEIPKHKLGVFALFRYWKKRELLVYPFLLRIESPSFQFVLRIVSLTQPDEASSVMEDTVFLRRFYHRARMHCVSLKGAVTICQRIYNSSSIEYTAELLYEFMRFTRIMWVASLYVNKSENFFEFMSRVQHVIIERTKQILEINNFLSMPPLKAQKTAVQVIYLLRTWREVFFEFFDLNELDSAALYTTLKVTEFGLLVNINNMAKMAYDLFYLAKHFKHYTNLFDRRLSNIVIDDYKVNVWNLTCSNSTHDLRTTNYDIFDFANDKRWDNILRIWYQSLPLLEKRSKLLIDDLFKNLRDPISATKYLLSIKSNETSKSLHAHLMSKFKYCAIKFIEEVIDCVVETRDVTMDYTKTAYRNQPASSAIIIWLETLMEYIFREFRYVVTVNEMWKRADTKVMKKVYLKFLDFYHIHQGMKLTAFMEYRLQSDFWESKYASTGNVDIAYAGPDELTHHYCEQVTPYFGKFLSYRETVTNKRIVLPKRRTVFRQDVRFEWFKDIEPTVKHIAKSGQGRNDKMPQELKDYFDYIKAVKHAKDKKLKSTVDKFITSYYDELSKSTNQLVRRVHLKYTMYDIFLHTGKISSSYIPLKTIKHNVSMTKNFIVSNNGQYIFYASSFKNPDLTEETEVQKTSSLRQKKRHHKPSAGALASKYLDVAKLVTNDTLETDQLILPRLSGKNEIQMRYLPQVKYSFLAKFNMWQNQDLKHIIEKGIGYVQFNFQRELIMLAFIRELINKRDLKTILSKVETYKENKSLMPIIGNNKCELSPLYEFVIISAIYMSLNKRQIRFLETMFLVFQNLFYKERAFNKIYHSYELSQYECESVSPCDSSLSSLDFNYASEIEHFSYDNAYFDECEQNYDSDNIFGSLVTLSDFIYFLNGTFIDCDTFLENTTIRRCRRKKNVFLAKPGGRNFLVKCLLPRIDDELDEECDLLVDFVFENYLNIMHKHKTKSLKKAHDNVEDRTLATKQRSQPGESLSVYPGFDEIYRVDSLLSVLFGDHEEEEEEEEEPEDDRPIERPLLTSIRKSSIQIAEVSQKVKKGSSDDLSEYSSASQGLSDASEIDVDGEAEPVEPEGQDEIEAGADKQEIELPDLEYKPSDVDKKEDFKKLESEKGRILKPSKMFYVDNIEESFRCYGSFFPELQSREYLFISGHSDLRDDIKPDADIHRPLETFKDSPKRKITKEEDKLIEKASESCSRLKSCGKIRTPHLWPVKDFMRLHLRHLRPLRLPARTVNMITKVPFIRQRFVKPSKVQRLFMFCKQDSKHVPKQRASINFLGVKPLPYYEAQKFYRKMAEQCFRRYAKYPALSSTNRHIERLFSSYAAFVLRKYSKNNEVAQCMQSFWNNKPTKRNKFIAWKFSYFQNEIPMFEEIKTLLPKIKNESLRKLFQKIIKKLRVKWDGHKFIKYTDDEDILELSWRDILLKYPILYRGITSSVQKAISTSIDKNQPPNFTVISTRVPSGCEEKCVDDLQYDETTTNNNRDDSSYQCLRPQMESSFEQERTNNANDICKILANPKLAGENSIPGPVSSWSLIADFDDTENSNLTMEELDNKFKIIMQNRRNYRKKCRICFKPGRAFYELVFNSKNFLESRCLNDGSVRFICNDYPFFVEKIHKFLRLISCYNNFVMQLNEEESYFFRDLTALLTFYLYQNVKSYLRVRLLATEAQKFIETAIPASTVGTLRQLRETSNLIIQKYLKIKTFNWFEPPKYSEPLKSYFKSTMMNRKFTQGKLMRTVNSASYHFRVLDYLVANNCPGHNDNPRLFMYFENFEMMRISSSIRNINRNTIYFEKFLSSKRYSKPILRLMFRGKTLTYDVPLKEIGDLLFSLWVDYVKRYKYIPRWKTGTCEDVESVKIISKNLVHTYSVYDEWLRMEEVQETLLRGMMMIEKSTEALAAYRDRWSLFTKVWGTKRKSTIKYMFLHKNFDLVEITYALNFFVRHIHMLKGTKDYTDVMGFRVDIKDVLTSLISRFEKFTATVASQVRQRLVNFCHNFKKDLYKIMENFSTKDDFTKLLTIVQATKRYKELKYYLKSGLCYVEKSRILVARFGLKFGNELKMMIFDLKRHFDFVGLYIRRREKELKTNVCHYSYLKVLLYNSRHFRAKCETFATKYWFQGPRTCSLNLDFGLELVRRYKKAFKTLVKEKAEINKSEKLLNCRLSAFPLFDAVYEDFKIQKVLYKFYELFKEDFKIWKNQYWASFNSAKVEERLSNTIAAFRALPLELRNLPVAGSIRKLLTDIYVSLPLFAKLKNKALKARHWKQLRKRTEYPYFNYKYPQLRMEKFFKWKLYKYSEIIDEILDFAVNESMVKQKLINISSALGELVLQIVPYYNERTYRGVALDTNDEVLIAIDDYTLELQSLTSSPYSAPFLTNIHRWEVILMIVHDVLMEWLSVQRKWKYLESVFISGDLRNQLPNMAKKFDDVDKTYLLMTSTLTRQRKVVSQCLKPDTFNKFLKLSEILDDCQKTLVNYLDTKRNSFPRFYFISNDELLSILAAQSPEGIQDQMFKIFDNVCLLRFRPQKSRNIRKRIVSGLVSCEKEVLNFLNLRSTNAAIEKWLTGIVNEMRKSLKLLTKESIVMYGHVYHSRIEWMFNTLGVIVMAANKTYWTANVELAFQRFKRRYNKAMKDLFDMLKEQINKIVLRVRGKLAKNDRKKLNTVLIVDVHSKDIVGKLVSESITKRTSFEWECQLRYYWKSRHQSLRLRQCSGFFQFGYEYMGLNGRLVITPLTDRIFLTITQALALKLGGAPAGPAGTGKTETTKDLAKAMGRLCMVTNCGENMDYIQFGKILMGLCQSGAWGCFDEFNRIDISVLSVITTQMQIIREALLNESVNFFKFEGYKIYLDRKHGVFITMNPGYAGRTELPETIKALFRPVVCIVPDLEHICLIMLFSEGFLTAKILAKKMTLLYSLSKDRLSKQSHYDFGLRSLKPVLTVAGDLKRNSPELDEEVVIMRALRDMNQPKLVPEDEGLFLELIDDLFPGIQCERVTYPDFNAAVNGALSKMDYILISGQINKVVQMYETLMTRHSAAIVGPTRGGKSVIISTLCEAQNLMNLPTMIVVLNPKAFTVDELYGLLDPKTRDWIDGLLSNVFREMNQPIKKPERRYIMFDGDVDALWIENMNSVMDDNKILTLTSGERMRLLDHCALLFEVGDLRYASPATVSRCGVVFVDSEIVGYKPYWERWLYRRHDDEEISLLSDLFETFIPSTLSIIFKGSLIQKTKPLSFIIPQNEVNLVSQLCYVLESTLPKAQKQRPSMVPEAAESEPHALDESKAIQDVSEQKSQVPSKTVPKKGAEMVTVTQSVYSSFADYLYPRTDVSKLLKMNALYRKPPQITEDYLSYKIHLLLASDYNLIQPYNKYATRGRLKLEKNIAESESDEDYYHFQCLKYKTPVFKYRKQSLPIHDLFESCSLSFKKQANAVLSRLCHNKLFLDSLCKSVERSYDEEDDICVKDPLRVRFLSKWRLFPRVKKLTYGLNKILSSSEREFYEFCRNIFFSKGGCMRDMAQKDFWRLMKKDALENIVGDFNKLMRKKYSVNVNCKLGDSVLKHYRRIIQNGQKGKHFSAKRFSKKNDVQSIKEIQISQHQSVMKMHTRKATFRESKPSTQLFKLKKKNFMEDSSIDMLPGNKIVTDWLGNYWNENLYRLENTTLENTINDNSHSEPAQNRLKMYKLTISDLINYNKRLVHETTSKLQNTEKEDKAINNVNQLMVGEESESDSATLPETYALRKLSFQYRNIMLKIKSETSSVNVEVRKRLSIEKKRVSESKEVVTSEPEFKSFTSRSMFAPKLKETETVRRTFIDPMEQEKKKQFQKLRSIFIEAMYASIGATLIERDRSKFDNMIKKIMNIPEYPDTATTPALFDFIPCRMPLLYNYKTDVEKQCWVAWSDILKPYVHDKNKYFDEIFVPTEESSRIGRLLKLMQSVHRPVILVGESGTAKTAIMMEFLRNVSYDYVKLTLTFSSRTTSLDVQRNIETSLDKINKHTLGPPAGKEMIIFIDDLNMPTFDEYGTQQPIALLKLTVEKSGLFDREGDLSWKGLQNVMFIGAMGMTARSDQVVDPRFTSHFSVFNLTPPSDSTINRIYISILNGHTDDFLCDIHSLTPDIMKATLSIYKFLREEIPPSPIRFHYIFSLRDLSRVAAGLLQTTPNLFKTKKEFIRVWRNEIMRVFYDRLCLAEDQTKVYDYIEDVIDDVFPTMRRFVRNNPLIFGDYENFMNPDEPRFYKDLENYDVIYKIFAEILEDYNAHFSGMDLVLFEDALDHLTRIHRVLRLHRGNLLAIGVGGCGKRSLITLASYAAGCKMYSINLCKGYNESFFKEDLKKLYVMLGADRVKSTFFFTSSHIVQEDFLEYINSILTVGFIPSLFSDEDKDAIINKVRKNARAAGCGRTKGEVWNFFLDTCKNHLHMVLSMSPLGNVLRVRCRSIPSLVNNSTIDWIFPWPTAALNAVANRFLSGELIPANQRKLVIQHIVFTHKSTVHFADEFLARYNRTCFITPKHYLDFIKLYVKFVKEKSADNIARSHEYELGLQKMVEAYITVEKISAETLKQKEIVERQNIACEILLKDLTAATSVTTEKQSIAKTKSKEIQIQSVEIDKNKKEAEEALSTALPALNEAKIALDQLNKNDITEIRSFATPPVPVQIVCECVLILSGYTEIDWKNAKGMMADPNFLNTLKNMNVNKITKAQQKKVREHLAKSTKMEQMATISKAGYGLLMFVRAVLNYCVVYRIVKPKQERVEMLEKKFAKALEILEALNEEVRQLEKILADLNEKYSTAMKEKHRIQEEMELMLYRLAIANKLLHGLSSENERWKKEHANLKEEYEKIIGNCLITSSFLAYTGAFNWELRQEMMYDTWRKHINKLKIPFSSRYKLELELMDEMAISKLYTEGLPPDELSLQNALLVLCSSRFALCIDPQQQALRWLMKREKDFQPKILSFDDNNFLTVLEASIRIGTPVIFKDVEYVDSIIENLLEKNIKGKRGQKVVLIGNKEVEYHDNFRLYLVSKLPNPQFESWIYTKSTVVNCIVTIIGLEDQLLNVVARHERPDLEEARERLIEQTNLTKQSVKFFEKTLLIELANAKGNLLDNTVLIQTLESTKVRVTEMQKELHEAEENKAGFEVTRNEYRPVAKRGALLYFVLYDMASMNAMYIYSLDSYLKVFVDSLSRPVISIIISARVKKFIAILTKKVYDYGCNGLFERDKLLFSFQIALRLQQSLGLVSEEEFTFLIKGDSSLDKCKKSCPAKWFPAERWKDLVKLNADFSAFGDILIEFENNISDWEKWYNLAAPEKGKMPYEKYSALKPFEKLMLFRCLRVDRISECIPDYINSIMGPYFNKPPLISLEQIVSTSSPHEPVMFVLCPGANPIPKLVKCAEKQRSGALGTADLKILTISLGQGQEPRATKMFFDGRRKGYWVIFENCHLLPFFIAAIEKTREKQEKPPHPGFRLWFTTEPTEKFPLSVLQSTTRVVLEIAESFKLNLARTVKSIDKVDFREQVRIHPSFGHIIYVLAFFHAVLLERKKFGQVGFNVNYDFSECDFESCYQLIKKYLKKKSHNMRKAQKPGYDINAYNQYLYDRVPWEILRYLIGEIVYGGRVIDYYDRRTVSTYLEEYMDNFIYQSLTTFCFFKRMSLKYPVPLYNNLNLYNKQIRHLPDTTFPGVFGLHPNVEIAYNDAKTTKFWKNLMSLQPAEGSVSKAGSKKESLVSQIGKKITDIVPKSLYDVQKEKMRYEDYIQTLEVVSVTKVLRDPTVIILFQELAMFNVLIQSLIRSLDNLAKAIRGEIAMDALLENIFDCLYEGEIPISWKKLIPQTKKSLGQWMTHFKNRIIQYDDWLKEFKTSAIWLSGLHVPQAYLTAVMQRTTRLQGWSLDQTALYSFITKMRTDKKIKAVPQLGCYIKDLFIQGARWDCHMHALQPPRRKIQVELLPILAIRPIKVDQRKFVKSFQTPVYTTTDRRNAMGVGFVFEADIQTNSHYSVWVMKGVCMLLNKE